MGLFSAIGGLFGASGNRKAIQQAADAQNQKLQQGIDLTKANNAHNDELFSPYTTAGAGATTSIADMLGVNGPEKQAAAIQGLKDSPVFKSLYDTGQNTILQNASATGGLRGGNTQESLARFGADTLASTQQQQLMNLFGLSNEGLNAAGQNAGLDTQGVGSIAQMLGLQGQTSANSILGKHQATNAGVNNLTGFLDSIPSQLMGAMGMPTGNIGQTQTAQPTGTAMPNNNIAQLLAGFKF